MGPRGADGVVEGARRAVPQAPFVHMSRNKVYGDAPNGLLLAVLEARWDYADPACAQGSIRLRLSPGPRCFGTLMSTRAANPSRSASLACDESNIFAMTKKLPGCPSNQSPHARDSKNERPHVPQYGPQ